MINSWSYDRTGLDRIRPRSHAQDGGLHGKTKVSELTNFKSSEKFVNWNFWRRLDDVCLPVSTRDPVMEQSR